MIFWLIILSKRFISHIHFLNLFISYHNLLAKMYFLDHCAVLELRYLNLGNIVNLGQVRFRTFRVNDLLLIYYICFIYQIFKFYFCDKWHCLESGNAISTTNT
jgi:hypothetical protein